jgi:endoglucanase Acf2
MLGCGAEAPQVHKESLVKLASGYYAEELLPGEKPPSDEAGNPVKPRLTADFQGVPTTNEWWSSLLWKFRTEGSPYSEAMHPHPLTIQAMKDGFELGYPSEPAVEPNGYQFAHRPDIRLGVSGLSAAESQVAGYSDWTVTAELADGSHVMRATFGHGLPFVYVTNVKGEARVSVLDKGSVTSPKGNVAQLTVRGHHYAVFAPKGATWTATAEGDALVSDLHGADYYAVALLPNDAPETFALFSKYASSFVTGSHVSFRFDAASSKLVADFAFDTVDKENPSGPGKGTLFALYRHQYTNATTGTTALTYTSARGEMKLGEGAGFQLAYGLGSLLPTLPNPSKYSHGLMKGLVKIGANGELFPKGLEGARDSYWDGKNFGRNADLVYVADQLGNARLRDHLLDAIKAELEGWFDGQAPRYFYYDKTWHTVIGVPSVYFSGAQMNDHHFHYAYFVFAAATVAQFDPAWAEKWAPNVELLISDAGNWDRQDTRFPFMRNFDVYAGHSWAGGTTHGPRGNNEESSSEDVNFAGAVALWGEVMDKPEIRDAGLFMYASLVNAIEQYWFDVDSQVFPKGFEHPNVGIVWGDGGVYDTWFSNLPVFIHGIQFTPISVGSLWLGRRPDNIERNLQHLLQGNDGELHLWRDLFWMLEAMADPRRAAARFDDEHWFEPEGGNTMAHTYQFVSALSALGKLDTTVSADTPFYAVFAGEKGKSHVVFNGGSTPRTVRFSDGVSFEVPARSMLTK